MLRDGEYVAWFRTSGGTDTGNMLLRGGKISGSGTVISYSGSYAVHGEGLFTMKLLTQRRLAHHESLVGIDEVELTLAGAFKVGGFAACTGLVHASPATKVDLTLFPAQLDEVKPPIAYTTNDFHLERLPQFNQR